MKLALTNIFLKAEHEIITIDVLSVCTLSYDYESFEKIKIYYIVRISWPFQ